MSFILNIDTAVVGASVCLSKDAESISLKKTTETSDGAAWIHTAIQQLMAEQGISLHALAAVAVSAGPGSYTGLRIGMATAKGLCYALKLPLITISTLHMMVVAAAGEPTTLFCPMIDARRMEVFTGIYTRSLEEVWPAQALILQPGSFLDVLEKTAVTFFGNGSHKFQPLMQHPNAVFKKIDASAAHLVPLAFKALIQNHFADLAYSEPFYGKEFFSTATKQ